MKLLKKILYIAYIFYSQKIIHSNYIVYYRTHGRLYYPKSSKNCTMLQHCDLLLGVYSQLAYRSWVNKLTKYP